MSLVNISKPRSQPIGRWRLAPRRESHAVWYLFLLPTLLGILLFTLYPLAESLRLSFTRGVSEQFVGVQNYSDVLASGTFWYAVYNTLYITVFQLFIAIPLGFLIACLINSLRRTSNFFKVLFYIPNATSMVAAATVFLAILHPDGPLNYVMELLGLQKVVWLSQPVSAKWGAVILSVWHWLGFVIIINLANLQAIPVEYYEASSIDGASPIQQWWWITVPNMIGSLTILFVLGWIGGLQRFADAYMLGGLQGSPARSLHTVVGFIFERGFGGSEYGIASAAAYILFVFILIFTYINTKLLRMKI
ncbi:carbohydrate ABC transporter permease [Paenibacillus tarimensis]|uniref:carbohydrate ABC transporter permease n=1 Tax=Paenibacillus tarimensis TaxID=416012 RepID=UPI001F191177|nr:sugar ABC transporter permease [Paenibacillus tarimensis]MCF2944323.1 sugar ABC transporter permease [Paenibacillus tarimensis]